MSMNKCMNQCVKSPNKAEPDNQSQKEIKNITVNIPVCASEVNNSAEVVREMELIQDNFQEDNQSRDVVCLQQNETTSGNIMQTMNNAKKPIQKNQKDYDKEMILKYKPQVMNGGLIISYSDSLESLSFTDQIGVKQHLSINMCENVNLKVAPLKNLYFVLEGPANINGIGQMKQLKSLLIYNNTISDISEIKNLVKLTRLDIQCTQIQCIDAVQNLTALTIQYLSSNEISSISSLKKLKNLEDLKLNSNKIQKLQGLEDLKKLKTLNLQNNYISDFTPIINHPNFKQYNICNQQCE
ncbi:leucine-rich_repeat domain-containing protein [Hexamita inflata]|uniref:Partial n=1 Tax=Hexamita inflata TaxID=28002 RepID=A0AA86UMW6_9EUKA|nr:leucine-rich repeat domain-containing protein [Hexamita inflata]